MDTLKKAGRTKQAKAQEIGRSMNYRVQVTGRIWAGHESAYEYSFDHRPTEPEIETKAGDFQTIFDYRIISVLRIEYMDGHRVIRSVIRDWQDEGSAEMYLDCCHEYLIPANE